VCAEKAYDLIRENHPTIPTFSKDRSRVVGSWALQVDKFLKRTKKSVSEVQAFFTWLAADKQNPKPGDSWVGCWQPFQSVSILDKDWAWARFAGSNQSPSRRKETEAERCERESAITEKLLEMRNQ